MTALSLAIAALQAHADDEWLLSREEARTLLAAFRANKLSEVATQIESEHAALFAERDGLRAEVERLSAWLYHIDGGDTPCLDESQLRQWAHDALTLGHPAP